MSPRPPKATLRTPRSGYQNDYMGKKKLLTVILPKSRKRNLVAAASGGQKAGPMPSKKERERSSRPKIEDWREEV